jgi:ATPase subunit of ABC transporter with duplicated ATPase domains
MTEVSFEVLGDELEHKVAAIATKLGFLDLTRPVASMSNGERGRLHLGVILARAPQILILDEPTNHLDLEHDTPFQERATCRRFRSFP